MSLFDLALRNVKRNLGSYVTFLVSMVFSIIVFYVFFSIYYNEQFLALAEEKMKLKVAFRASAIVVLFFSVVFLWYSSSFFIRRRKKEIATYGLLGMAKGQIGRMLFYENVLLGLLSLIIGICSGIMLSKLFVMMLVRFMREADHVRFAIEERSVITTLAVFGTLFLANGLYSALIIYRYKLISLFTAQKEGERAPRASWLLSIASLLFIGYAYWAATQKMPTDPMGYFFPVLITVIIGTFLLFTNFMVILIKWLKRNKSHYYRGTNLVSTSQLLYRIKGNARSLAIIAVMTAITITAVGSTYSYYQTVNAWARMFAPGHIQYKKLTPSEQERVDEVVHKHASVIDQLEFSMLSIEAESHDYKPTRFSENRFRAGAVRLSDYQRASQSMDLNPVTSLAPGELYLIEGAIGQGPGGGYQGNEIKVLFSDWKSYRIQDSDTKKLVNNYNGLPILIVPDEDYEALRALSGHEEHTYTTYMIQNPKSSEEVHEQAKKSVPDYADFSTFYEVYDVGFAVAGTIVFIGLFLGLLFLLATGSVIYFKQLMEASDDRGKYRTMQLIGMSPREIRAAVSKQLLVIFAMPLIVGLAHSAFSLILVQKVLREPILQHALVVMGGYAAAYLLYYFLTLRSYMKLIHVK